MRFPAHAHSMLVVWCGQSLPFYYSGRRVRIITSPGCIVNELLVLAFCYENTQCTVLLCITAALQALKRKKRYEKQLNQIDGTLSTIEFQREALENSHTNTEVLRNMGYAAQAMKKVHENM